MAELTQLVCNPANPDEWRSERVTTATLDDHPDEWLFVTTVWHGTTQDYLDLAPLSARAISGQLLADADGLVYLMDEPPVACCLYRVRFTAGTIVMDAPTPEVLPGHVFYAPDIRQLFLVERPGPPFPGSHALVRGFEPGNGQGVWQTAMMTDMMRSRVMDQPFMQPLFIREETIGYTLK